MEEHYEFGCDPDDCHMPTIGSHIHIGHVGWRKVWHALKKASKEHWHALKEALKEHWENRKRYAVMTAIFGAVWVLSAIAGYYYGLLGGM